MHEMYHVNSTVVKLGWYIYIYIKLEQFYIFGEPNLPSVVTKLRSLSSVVHCDKKRRAFENTMEMLKTRAAGSCFVHFESDFKCPECFIAV